MDTSDLAKRMKAYENCYRIYLPRRQAVVVRIDGRAFHSFTKGFARPYDEIFARAMQETTKQLCENISGCKFAYQQSDEISLVLTDYETIDTEPWFGNNLQKIVSISAAMATFYFNDEFKRLVCEEAFGKIQSSVTESHQKSVVQKLCVFDSRAFLLPREEVVNYFIYRQLDCRRNSIQMTAQSYFSHNALQGLNGKQLQEKLLQEKNISWERDCLPEFRNGSATYKHPTEITMPDGNITVRNKWIIDKNIPIFSTQPNFINKHIFFDKS